MPALDMGADLNLGQFFIVNFKPEPVASLPGTVTNGRMVFLTSDGRFYVGFGGAWQPMGVNVQALEGITPAQLRDRATHSGSQSAGTINDLKTTVIAYKLNEFAAPTAAVGMGGQQLTGLANGSASTDAITKAQLDAVAAIANAAASGIAVKAPVRLVTTSNVSLSGLSAVEGVTPAANDRILVTGQTTPSQNGIYLAASGAWARATDADQTGELAPGTLVSVREGSSNADTLWGLISDAAITIGTTSQTWGKILSSTGEVTVAGNGIDKTGVTLSIKLGSASGLSVSGAGLVIDNTTVSRKAFMDVPAGTPPILLTHNLGTVDIDVTVRRVSDGKQILVPWNNLNLPNGVYLELGQASVAAGEYRAKIDT